MTDADAAMQSGSSKTVRLRDGRTIGYEQFGLSEGPAVFVFHGNPGARLDVLYAGHEALAGLGARVIAPDRPGIGLSSFQPRRKLADWPADLNNLADALGINGYYVVGAVDRRTLCTRMCPGVFRARDSRRGHVQPGSTGGAGRYSPQRGSSHVFRAGSPIALPSGSTMPADGQGPE